jgi:hypothetical protein
MIRLLLSLALVLNAFLLDAAEKIIYPFSAELVDVVIPCTDKDLISLEMCIAGIRENCQVRRVIVVSDRKLTDSAEWFDEANYPFSKQDVAFELVNHDLVKAKSLLTAPGSRVGWYFQQLLKLYAPFTIPEVSSNLLVLDADTVFLNPVEFLNDRFGGLYNVGQQHNSSYFQHADRLTGGVVKKIHSKYSGISHHMLFQRSVMEDLFDLVECTHQQPFWIAFCQSVDEKELSFSGASEYELYFNFVLSRTDQVNIRKLLWQNIPA